MAQIKSVQMKDAAGRIRKVQTDSKAYKNIIAGGGSVIENAPSIPTSQPAPKINPNQTTAEDVIRNTEASISRMSAMSTPVPSPVPATQIQPAPTINLPEPIALDTTKAQHNTILGEVTKAKSNLTEVLNTQKNQLDKEIADLTKEQQSALDAGKELTEPFRAKLEEKERERLKINENFEANQKLTNELDSLLTQSNELINIATGRQVSGKVLEKSLSKTLADVQARAGVIQAVMAARNDQINVAENFIDRTVAAITADKNDELSYYNTIIDLTDKKILNLSTEKYNIAKVERDQAVKEVESAQATADYIKGLMINPETAQFIADAGVSLTDNIDTINAKMGKQANIQEAVDMRNSLVDAGYEISPVPVAGGIEVQAGGQTIYAKVRAGSELAARIEAQQASAAASRASAARTETGRLIDLAKAGDPSAISALGLTMDNNKTPSPDLIAYAGDYAATGKLPTASSLPSGVTVGAIAELGRSLPKPDGAIVSTNTGVMASNLSAEEDKAITAMSEIVNDTLPFMMQKWNEAQMTNFGGTGVVGGIASKLVPSQAMTEYKQARDEFLSKLLVARSGAAVTEQEYARYAALVPGEFNQAFFLGNKGETLLQNLDSLMTTNFDNYLNANQLSVYGYSTVDVPAEDITVSIPQQYGSYTVNAPITAKTKARKLTVGEIIENEYGQQGFVQPDGTITLINP